MSEPFSQKFEFVLKVLSMSRSQVAAALGVDKSVVGRWASGAVRPSSHNLSHLTALVAAKVGRFTNLDWERNLEELAQALGCEPGTTGLGRDPSGARGLAIPLLDAVLATTALRAGAYEGFFRSTRSYAQRPGAFIHDQVMIRLDPSGYLRFDMGAGGVKVQGWVLALQSQLFVIGAELTSGAFAFAILNGVNTVKAGTIDGLLLNCALDASRTPTACPVIFERTGDLTGDRAADDARFAQMAQLEPEAVAESVPEAIRRHLEPDVGPAQRALGGDLLLRMPLARSKSGGMSSR